MDVPELIARKRRWTWRLHGVSAERIARELPLRRRLLGQLLAASAGALAVLAVVLVLARAGSWTLLAAVVEPALVLTLAAVYTRRGRTIAATSLLLVAMSHSAAFTMSHFGLRHASPALLALTIAACGLLIGAYFVVTWTAVCTLMVWFIAGRLHEDWRQALAWSAVYAATGFLVVLFSRHLEHLLAASRAAEERERGAVVAERTRFAREIHDTLAQGFTGIVMQLNAAEERLEVDPAGARRHLEKARALARQSLDEARRSVRALRPGCLANGDLLGAMDQIGQQLTAGSDIRFASHLEGEPYALSEEVEAQLLRIGQEALTNAVRHARASHIDLCLRFAPRITSLEVSDDGAGLAEEARAAGFGLRNMAERARQLGGELIVQSAAGRGSRIIASVPSG